MVDESSSRRPAQSKFRIESPRAAHNQALRAVFVFLLVSLLSACDLANKLMIGPVALEYAEAWENHDIDKIVAMHSEDSVFHLHFTGQEPAVGKVAIRAAVETVLSIAPDYRTTEVDLKIGSDYVVLQYIATMTPQEPYSYGQTHLQPNGHTFDVEIIDVITFDGGKVTAKHTYLDAEAVFRHSLTNTRPELKHGSNNPIPKAANQ